MKESILAGLAAVFLCIAVAVAVTKTLPAPAAPTQQTTASSEATEAAQNLPTPEPSFDERFVLPVLSGDTVVSMQLHSYLVGAVLGEMPASFEQEALQAQAVACRTYVLRRYANRKHDSAAVCTDAACCLRWEEPSVYEQRERVEEAVTATDGEVVLYGGELIDATFFSCSGGHTEAAAAVWGSDLPYLQAVASPGEENAAHDSDSCIFSREDFCEILKNADESVSFDTKSADWVGELVRTSGGGVESIVLGGRSFTGKQLRKLFGLNSTNFTLEIAEQVQFSTRGYGHRVGMSQYGAQAMAQDGKTHAEILQWYYTGTEIKKLPRFAPEQPIG